MSFWVACARRGCAALVTFTVLATAGCGGVFGPQYEYEEDLYPALDGSATLYVSASVAALVALRGVDLDLNPRAPIDRNRVRALFEAPGLAVRRPRVSHRSGRRFVHVRIDTPSVQALATAAPLSWSSYAITRRPGLVTLTQEIGAASGRAVGDVGWSGDEVVAFRLHVPGRIQFHNAEQGIERGNILTWEQSLAGRVKGVPLELEVRMESDSILFRTLMLFGSAALAALATLGLAVWWLARRKHETA